MYKWFSDAFNKWFVSDTIDVRRNEDIMRWLSAFFHTYSVYTFWTICRNRETELKQRCFGKNDIIHQIYCVRSSIELAAKFYVFRHQDGIALVLESYCRILITFKIFVVFFFCYEWLHKTFWMKQEKWTALLSLSVYANHVNSLFYIDRCLYSTDDCFSLLLFCDISFVCFGRLQMHKRRSDQLIKTWLTHQCKSFDQKKNMTLNK